MHNCAAYQIKTGHLLHVGDDVEEVLCVEAEDDGVCVETRNVTSLVPNYYILKRHAEVLVE